MEAPYQSRREKHFISRDLKKAERASSREAVPRVKRKEEQLPMRDRICGNTGGTADITVRPERIEIRSERTFLLER